MTAHAPNISNFFPGWIEATVQEGHRLFTRWHTRRRTYGRLMSLDDHLLQDIGLTRADIWSAASGDIRKTAVNGNSSAHDAA